MTTNERFEAIKALLAECGCGTSGTQAEWKAAERLCGVKASTENLVLALNALDGQLRQPISAYSTLAAVSADADDYAVARDRVQAAREWNEDHLDYTRPVPAVRDLAQARHARRERAALAEMTAPDPATVLRDRSLAVLRERGVQVSDQIGSVRAIADLIRARRAFRAAAAKNPAVRENNRPHAERVEAELAAFGV